jgi:hypothetical protein
MMSAEGGNETYAALLEKVADDLRDGRVNRWVDDKPPREPASTIALRNALCDDLIELLLVREGVEDPLDLIRADLEKLDATSIIEHWHDDHELPGAVEDFFNRTAEDHQAPPGYKLPSASQLRRALLQTTILPWLGSDDLTVLAHREDDLRALLGPGQEVPDDRRGRGLVHLAAHAIGRARH